MTKQGMTLDEAIKILLNLGTSNPHADTCGYKQALQLGIEALKRIKQKGILFKPDVWQGKLRAIEKYGEAETRRLGGLKEINQEPDKWNLVAWDANAFLFECKICGKTLKIKPSYQTGETVYIKEAWFVGKEYDVLSPCGLWNHPEVGFLSLYKDIKSEPGRMRSPIHLPAWAARYFIQMEVKPPERLQEITEESAIKEGIVNDGTALGVAPYGFKVDFDNPISAFIYLWDSINPDYPWSTNPWVFPYSFKLVRK